MPPSSPTNQADTKSDVTAELDSRQQPAWHVIVLGVFTAGFLYVPYWGFKTWRDLNRESIEVLGYPDDEVATAAGIARPTLRPVPPRKPGRVFDEHTRETLRTFSKMSPGLRGLGLLVPILNIYLMATLTLAIANLVPDANSFPRRKPIEATLLTLGGFIGILSLAHLPSWFFMVSFLAMVPIAYVQHWLNQYWESVESENLLVRHGFNIWEMLIIIVGALLQGGVIAGYMIGIKS